jgi:branched-chain amino acid transport system substrate-binding protein
MFPFSFHFCASSLHLIFMPAKIGVLLPRSVEYPSMSFDLLDGLRLCLKQSGQDDFQFFTENIGFGENPEVTNACAEKLVMQHDVDMIVAYATSLNAESLYSFAETTNKPFLFLDAGMELFEAPPHRLCRHLTLQGLMACQVLGDFAGTGGGNVISAASFFDGGYRSSWVFQNAIVKNGGSIVGHFVSQFREDDFTIAPLLEQIKQSGAEAVTAAFSSYFDGLFMKALGQTDLSLRNIPFYCAPFMADEQLLPAIPFPGGDFQTVVPWSLNIENDANKFFVETIKKEKNKTADIFHLLGWEAGITVKQILSDGIASVDDWSFESPRGKVCFHPDTHNAYAPLYEGKIEKGEQGECRLVIDKMRNVTAEEHRLLHFAKPEGSYSRWKNNYFCI